MKRFICILIALFLLTSPALAFQPEEWVHQSAQYTADQNAIVTGGGYLYGIVFGTDDANDITAIKVYDNTTATGTQLLPQFIVTSESGLKMIWFAEPVAFSTGISIDITLGAGNAYYMVYYRMK